MQKPAPVIQSADQATHDLHKRVSHQLKQMGQHAPTVPVNADTPPPLTEELKKVGGEVVGDLSHVLGTTLGETIGGEVSHIRQNPSRGWLRGKLDRLRKVAQHGSYTNRKS